MKPTIRNHINRPLPLFCATCYAISATIFTPAVHAQDDTSTADLLKADSENQSTPFSLNRIQLLSLKDIAAGTPLALDQFEPRTTMGEFTADFRAGEDTRDLAIENVRLLALENNLDLKAQFVSPEIAHERVREEKGRFDSVFSGNLKINSAEQANTSPPPDKITVDGHSAALQLDMPLHTGGNITLAIPTSFSEPDIPGVKGSYDSSISFSVSQPLLKNAGRKVNDAAIEIAKLSSTQEQARTKLFAIQTLSNAETAYWDYYSASETLKIRTEQYERALELERKAKRLAEARVVSQIEVTRATSGVARKIDGIIVAESQRRLTQRALKLLLNSQDLPLDGPTNLIATSAPDPEFFPLDRAQVLQMAIDNRLDLIDKQLQLSVEDLTLLFNENQQKPSFDLNATTAFSASDESLGSSFGSDFTSWEIGATFSVPIGNDAAKARSRQSELRKERAETNIKIQERLISQQVLNALDQLEQSWQRILSARQEAVLAGATFEAEERQFLAGVRTSSDVLEAADFLAEAQIREIQAMGAYEQDKISAALATGTLLGKGQVELTLD